MKVIASVLVSLLKAAFRVPIDICISALKFLRLLVSPKRTDFIFTSKADDLDGFSFLPGDLVIEKGLYQKIVKENTPNIKLESVQGRSHYLMGTVVGYDYITKSVMVSHFNYAEFGYPVVCKYKEKQLVGLKSPLEELQMQMAVAEVFTKLEQEVDPLDGLGKAVDDFVEEVEDDKDDDDNSGGPIVH